MSLDSITEASLDKALAEALFHQKEFAQWFLSRTRFGNESAQCDFCRSDNPWSSVKLERANAVSGELELLFRQCETDVLAVYQTLDGRRLALHIENKLAGGSFTPDQPTLYKERLEQWKDRAKLGRYSEATSVLIAPREFYSRNGAGADVFETYIPHEEIATHLPLFARRT